MKSCDKCPGGEKCAAEMLHPVLAEVRALYVQGVTDKMQILLALDEDSEALLAKQIRRVERACWSKGALLAMAESLAAGIDDGDWPAAVEAEVGMVIKAFENFPWHVDDLVDQASDLYAAINERNPESGLADALSKRQFAKICKTVAYR